MSDKTRHIGRPKLALAEQRTERLSGLRLTVAERQLVEMMAARAGLPVAEFQRRAVLGQRIRARPVKVEQAALAEVNRIGVNLNQIAARVNMTGDLAADFRATLAALRLTLEQLAEAADDGS